MTRIDGLECDVVDNYRMRDVNDNDYAGVIEDVSEKPKTSTKHFDPSIKEDIQ